MKAGMKELLKLLPLSGSRNWNPHGRIGTGNRGTVPTDFSGTTISYLEFFLFMSHFQKLKAIMNLFFCFRHFRKKSLY
jgi:hypothetical protein